MQGKSRTRTPDRSTIAMRNPWSIARQGVSVSNHVADLSLGIACALGAIAENARKRWKSMATRFSDIPGRMNYAPGMQVIAFIGKLLEATSRIELEYADLQSAA